MVTKMDVKTIRENMRVAGTMAVTALCVLVMAGCSTQGESVFGGWGGGTREQRARGRAKYKPV